MTDPHPLGRPALDPTQPSTSVSISLPMTTFDGLCVRAAHEGVSVPEIIRRDLATAALTRRRTADDDEDQVARKDIDG